MTAIIRPVPAPSIGATVIPRGVCPAAPAAHPNIMFFLSNNAGALVDVVTVGAGDGAVRRVGR
jgi:hypothetical protein